MPEPADQPLPDRSTHGAAAAPEAMPCVQVPRHDGELVLVKDGQRYVFKCAPGGEKALLGQLAAMAQDPTHELTWFDAAVLSHQLGRNLQTTIGGLNKAS